MLGEVLLADWCDRYLGARLECVLFGGRQLPAEGGAVPFATLLARLIDSAPGPADVPELAPSPSWTGWDHPGTRLWPDRDDQSRDLNSTPGPVWVDDTASRVRERLCASAAPVRIGHGDWESQNIRWSSGRPLAVHDWDSAATVAQSAECIVGYQQAAGRQWAEQEVQDAWAAGLWVRLFNAKKDAVGGGGPQLDLLAGEIGDRLALAALGNR